MEIKADDGTSRKRTAEHEVWGQVLVGAEASILSFFFFHVFMFSQRNWMKWRRWRSFTEKTYLDIEDG